MDPTLPSLATPSEPRTSLRPALGPSYQVDMPGQTTFEPPRAPGLAEYTDFRTYLKDMYEFRRATESTIARPYSFSDFSAAADIRSPNYLKLIIEGKRNLSADMILKFARALRLSKDETEEFRILVSYGQSTDPSQRNHFLKQLAQMRAEKALSSGAIEAKNWAKVPGWIGWVLYAMAEQAGVTYDIETLQKLIRVRTSKEEIRAALNKLLEGGDLVPDAESGTIKKGRDLIESPQDLPVALIRNLQAELIYLGIESLFRDSPKEREFGALTVALTAEEYDQVRFELRQMRKRLQKDLLLKRKSSRGDRVYQLNIQLFPVTEKT